MYFIVAKFGGRLSQIRTKRGLITSSRHRRTWSQHDLDSGSLAATGGPYAAMHAFVARVRACFKFIVTHDTRIIIAAPVEPPCAARAAQGRDDGECLLVETPGELEAIAHEIPRSFSHAKLRKAVERGSFLVCVRRPAQIIAYRMCERAVFQSPGHRRRISPHFAFIHYVEVLPQYRGQRIARQLKEYVHRYARSRDIRWTIGLVSVTNRASLAAHLRAQEGASPRAVGRIDILHLFGGRLVLETPWWLVRKALDRLAH